MRKIIADSSADTLKLMGDGEGYASVPMTILTDEKEYVDTADLDVTEMVDDLLSYRGRSSTACPGVGAWLEAFGEAEEIFCVTITSNLSGSYNAAAIAAREYEAAHPDRRVFVLDSLSTGPEMRLLLEWLYLRIEEDAMGERSWSFEELCKGVSAYREQTGLLFVLESMKNLANNGRVSRLAATAAGILGIRAVGKASDVGTLEMLEKCRGAKKVPSSVVEHMVALGYGGGAVRISHVGNDNRETIRELVELLKDEYGCVDVDVYPACGLCSFYAEKGGLLIGFEKG
ncbi:MAG: DegV family protein [Clostridia bacterium]|nr:DegV family protein [Clostridia bacterium]